jgi:hypothetical protein
MMFVSAKFPSDVDRSRASDGLSARATVRTRGDGCDLSRGLAGRRSSTRKTRGGKFSVLQSLENPQNRKIVSTTRRPKDGVGVER